MTRLYLFAEGQTEQTFADTVLKPHLAICRVYMHNPVLIAHARKKGKVHRGGGRNFETMHNDILRFLKQESGSDVFFTTMIDLYGLPQDFPGAENANKLQHIPYDRVQALETEWAKAVGDRRFIPFIQLHEYEAYLFADVSKLSDFYDHAEKAIAALQAVSDGVTTPELINDGPHTAPSKRIIAQLPDYVDAKTTVGPQAAQLIGLPTIRSRCPHFNDWLNRLESLASEKG